jgi:hypothetical protein
MARVRPSWLGLVNDVALLWVRAAASAVVGKPARELIGRAIAELQEQ